MGSSEDLDRCWALLWVAVAVGRSEYHSVQSALSGAGAASARCLSTLCDVTCMHSIIKHVGVLLCFEIVAHTSTYITLAPDF